MLQQSRLPSPKKASYRASYSRSRKQREEASRRPKRFWARADRWKKVTVRTLWPAKTELNLEDTNSFFQLYQGRTTNIRWTFSQSERIANRAALNHVNFFGGLRSTMLAFQLRCCYENGFSTTLLWRFLSLPLRTPLLVLSRVKRSAAGCRSWHFEKLLLRSRRSYPVCTAIHRASRRSGPILPS